MYRPERAQPFPVSRPKRASPSTWNRDHEGELPGEPQAARRSFLRLVSIAMLGEAVE
jgi:hypothetical protein